MTLPISWSPSQGLPCPLAFLDPPNPPENPLPHFLSPPPLQKILSEAQGASVLTHLLTRSCPQLGADTEVSWCLL